MAATFIGIACSGGPWYFHGWREHQNPVFPITVKIGERTIFPGMISPDLNAGMVEYYTKATGAEAYCNTLREVWRVPSLSSWSGGLGAVMFIIGIPSLCLFAIAGLGTSSQAAVRRIVIAAFLALTAVTPTLAIARFALFQPVIGAIAFAWLVTNFPLVVRVLACIVAGAAAAYDTYMVLPSIQFYRSPPALLAFNLLSGHQAASLLNVYPDQYTVLHFWREEVSGPGKKLAIHSTKLEVFFAYAPWAPAEIMRVRDPEGETDLRKWHQDLLLNGVTHLYVKRGEAAWDLALSRPDLFPLLMRRLDSHWNPMDRSFYIGGWSEDALFQVGEQKL